jgi:hypothetical protein
MPNPDPVVDDVSKRVWFAVAGGALNNDPWGLREAAMRALTAEASRLQVWEEAEKTAAILEDARTIGEQLMAVKRPSDMLALLNGAMAQKYNLPLYTAGIDPIFKRPLAAEARPELIAKATGAFNDARDLMVSLHDLTQKGDQAVAIVRGLASGILAVPLRPTMDDLARQLERGLGSSAGIPENVIRVVKGELNLSDAMPEIRTRVTDEIATATDQFVQQLKEKAQQEVNRVLTSISPEIGAFNELRVAGKNGDMMGAVAALAALSGNKDMIKAAANLKRNVDTFNTIRSAFTLFAAGGSGGATLALGALSGGMAGIAALDMLSQEPDSSAAVLEAIERLASEMRQQFAVVNSKLDFIAQEILNVRAELREIKIILVGMEERLKAVQESLMRIEKRLVGIESRLDALARGLKFVSDTQLATYLANAELAIAGKEADIGQIAFNDGISHIKSKAEYLQNESRIFSPDAKDQLIGRFVDEFSVVGNSGENALTFIAAVKSALPDPAAARVRGAIPSLAEWQFLIDGLCLLTKAYPKYVSQASPLIKQVADLLEGLGEQHRLSLQSIGGISVAEYRNGVMGAFERYKKSVMDLFQGLRLARSVVEDDWYKEHQAGTHHALDAAVLHGLPPHIPKRITLNVPAIYASLPLKKQFKYSVLYRLNNGQPGPFSMPLLQVHIDCPQVYKPGSPTYIEVVTAAFSIRLAGRAEILATRPYMFYFFDWNREMGKWNWERHIDEYPKGDDGISHATETGQTVKLAETINGVVASLMEDPRVEAAYRAAMKEYLRFDPLEHVVIEYRARQSGAILDAPSPQVVLQPPPDPANPGVVPVPVTTTLDALLVAADESLAALRAHIVMTVPEIYARSESLRMALFGDDTVRLVDGSLVKRWARCSRELKKHFDSGAADPMAAARAADAARPAEQRICHDDVLRNIAQADWGVAGTPLEYEDLMLRAFGGIRMVANDFRDFGSVPINTERGTLNVCIMKRLFDFEAELQRFPFGELDRESYPALNLPLARLATVQNLIEKHV